MSRGLGQTERAVLTALARYPELTLYGVKAALWGRQQRYRAICGSKSLVIDGVSLKYGHASNVKRALKSLVRKGLVEAWQGRTEYEYNRRASVWTFKLTESGLSEYKAKVLT